MNLIKKLIFFLTIYLPIEEFILKWLPVPIFIFDYLLLISDLTIVIIVLLFVFKSNFVLKIKSENIYLLLFLFFSLFSLFYYQELNAYILKIWVLVRYIILFFIIRKIFYLNDFKRFEKYFFYVFTIQLLVGFVQYFELPFLYDFFNPRSDLPKAANWLVKGESGLAGTFTFTVNYGYFMFAFSAFILLVDKSINKKLFLIFVASLLSLFSESSISFLVTFSIFLRYFSLVYPKYFYRFFIFIFIFSIVFLRDFLSNIFSPLFLIFNMFSEQWIIESLMFTRLGILKLFPLFFSNDLFTILFGFSLDGEALTIFVKNIMGSEIPAILSNNTVIGIEDVYWIAHLYYFGLFGILFYGMIFKHIYKKLKFSKKVLYQKYIEFKVFRFYIILTMLTAFVNQTFSFKSFIFYFFVTIAYAMFKIEYKNKKLINSI